MTTVIAPTTAKRALVPVFAPRSLPPRVGVVQVVIPALNEGRVIGRVVHEVVEHGFDCLVIDDGSSDETGAVARLAGATVLRHLVNLGQGAALQTGIDWALDHGADRIVTFDGDGQHRAADIAVLLDTMSRNDADYALGSRFLGTAVNLPRARRLLLRAATWFTRLQTGMRVTDTHDGLRAMTRRGAAVIHLRQNAMAHASEILCQIADSRLRWVEVPVTIEYSPYTLAKGQNAEGLVAILVDLLMGRLNR